METENIGTATVMDNDENSPATPVIFLHASKGYILEGESFDLFARRENTATSTPISVNVELTSDARDNFLAPNSRGLKTIIIPANEREGKIMITSQADGQSGNHGNIVAELLPGAGYLATDPLTVAIIDVIETLPVVSISEIATVNEADERFTITLVSEDVSIVDSHIIINSLSVADANSDDPQYNPQINN